jgi:hypothetical protein
VGRGNSRIADLASLMIVGHARSTIEDRLFGIARRTRSVDRARTTATNLGHAGGRDPAHAVGAAADDHPVDVPPVDVPKVDDPAAAAALARDVHHLAAARAAGVAFR